MCEAWTPDVHLVPVHRGCLRGPAGLVQGDCRSAGGESYTYTCVTIDYDDTFRKVTVLHVKLAQKYLGGGERRQGGSQYGAMEPGRLVGERGEEPGLDGEVAALPGIVNVSGGEAGAP